MGRKTSQLRPKWASPRVHRRGCARPCWGGEAGAAQRQHRGSTVSEDGWHLAAGPSRDLTATPRSKGAAKQLAVP